jgi:hypothetical protein
MDRAYPGRARIARHARTGSYFALERIRRDSSGQLMELPSSNYWPQAIFMSTAVAVPAATVVCWPVAPLVRATVPEPI